MRVCTGNGKGWIYMRDGLHLSGKGAAVFADELSAAVGSGKLKTKWFGAI